jgi:hypothetical protein
MQAHAYQPMLDMIMTGALQPPAMTDFRGVGITVIDRF